MIYIMALSTGNDACLTWASKPATIYEKGKTRLDLLSYQYYGDADFAWLIMQANPQYGSIEFLIPDKVQIRIPYPLGTTLVKYEDDIDEYKNRNTL